MDWCSLHGLRKYNLENRRRGGESWTLYLAWKTGVSMKVSIIWWGLLHLNKDSKLMWLHGKLVPTWSYSFIIVKTPYTGRARVPSCPVANRTTLAYLKEASPAITRPSIIWARRCRYPSRVNAHPSSCQEKKRILRKGYFSFSLSACKMVKPLHFTYGSYIMFRRYLRYIQQWVHTYSTYTKYTAVMFCL